MGLLRDFLEGIKEQQKERDEIDDDKTQDRYLRSLRRQRRTQMEVVEKRQLIKDIKKFEKQRTRDVVLGTIPEEIERPLIKKKVLEKKIKIMRGRQFVIPKKRPQKSFLSKGNI